MPKNSSGEYTLPNTNKSCAETMAAYDALPAHIRKILQDAPYSMSVTNPHALMKSEKTIRATLTRVARESARATYGDNYPVDLIRV